VDIENHEGELLVIAFSAIQFLFAVFVKEASVVKAGQRIGSGIDLKFFEFLVLHQDGNAKKIRGRENIHHGGLERNGTAEAFGQFAAAREYSLPVFVALRLAEINLRNRAEVLTQELAAHRNIKALEGLNQEIQERVFGRRLRLGSFAGHRHQIGSK